MPSLAEIRKDYPQYRDLSDTELAGALHAKFYSDMPADEFAQKIGLKAPDKYQQAAEQEIADLRAKGVPVGPGYAQRVLHGATLGASDEILAAMQTPLEMVKRGELDPREAYAYTKARENLLQREAEQQQGLLGHAAELAGGVGTGIGAAGAGLTLTRAGMSLPARIAAGAAEGAGYGGVSGFFGGGDTFEDRFSAAGRGAAGGGLLGAALPAAGAVLSPVVAPVASSIRARFSPGGVADSQLARAVSESGLTPQEIENAVRQAAAEGQGDFTVADALGNAGQRMLSTVTRAPGGGRQVAVDFFENRQAAQGRRISNAIAEGFQAPETATQTQARLTAARDAAANAEYGAVRNDANRVNVVDTINHIDDIIGTQPGQQLQAPNDSIEGVLRGFRERLARVNPDDFAAVQRIRGDMADAAQSAAQSGHGNRARLIGGAMRQLDTAMEGASQGFLQANRNFAQASRDIEAIQAGRQAATRGRVEDTVPAYQALRPEAQAAFRAGYSDPLIAQAQGAAAGVNKARPLANDAFAAEAQAMAPGNDLMQRRLGREMQMFETRRQATGGSQTADNLADQSAMRVDPSVMGALLSGNVLGAGANALRNTVTNLSGYTPAVRESLGRLLLERGNNPSIRAVLQRVADGNARRGDLARLAKAAGYGGSAGLHAAISESPGRSSRRQRSQ